MTEIVLNSIATVQDLVNFAGAYKKGIIKLNISKMARELNKDPKTVRKYLSGTLPKETRERKKYLDLFREDIKQVLLDKKRSFDYIDHLYNYLKREHEISCSRSTLNRYIRMDHELNKLFNKKKIQTFYERFETKPGVQAQFDLKERIQIEYSTGELIRVNVATLTMGFSRYNFRKIVLDTKYETVVCFLSECFEKMGGTPHELVIDNIKCLVDSPRKANGADAILNNKFIEFLKDYNITCKPCMPYRPETKGKTETQNKKPSQLKNYNGTYRDLTHVHEVLTVLNKEDNEAISQATKLPRVFLLEKEKDVLHSLPSQSIRAKYHLSGKRVAVSNESLISYKSTKYSVPKNMIGTIVDLIIRDQKLHIYYNNKIITVHTISDKLLNIHDCHQLWYKKKNETVKINNDVIINEMRNINYD